MTTPISEIEELLDDLASAVASADLKGLERLVAEDVVWIYSGGSGPVRGARPVLDLWARHLETWQDVEVVRRETVVRIRGEVAWGSFLWDGKVSGGGHAYRLEGERWSVVMLRQSAGWRLAQVHSSMPYRDWQSHRVEGG